MKKIALILGFASLIIIIAAVHSRGVYYKKRNKKGIRESGQFYLELVERAKDGIGIIQDAEFKFVNPEFTNILGYSKNEILGKPFEFFAAAGERKKLNENYRQHIDGDKKESRYETVLLHKDGHQVNVEINAGVITYEGRPAILVFARDSGERKLFEEEHIKQSKLEAVGSLAAGIAHDFNNLLAVILGNIELARLFPKSEEKLAELLTKAEKAALKARDLTKRFLTFSEGGAPFKKLVVLNSIIKEALEVTLSGSRVKIRLNIPPNLWEINCDEDQIYQVFISLLDNAAEAMEGGGQVTIEAENLEIKAASSTLKPGKYVKITVKDEGEGIPVENLHKIFDPYFSTRGRVSQKGLGFGLPIVYSIIKQHAGHIEVESKVNVGTTVTFYLPIN